MSTAEGECNCTCQIAGCHDPDCAVYGPPLEPLPPRTCTCEPGQIDLTGHHHEACPALDDR